jgi:hypothetical protein
MINLPRTAPLAVCRHVDIATVNAAARSELLTLLARWFPDGREYETQNPRHADRYPGWFKVNLHTCLWSDIETDASEGDPVSLATDLFGLSQTDATRRPADMLGVR